MKIERHDESVDLPDEDEMSVDATDEEEDEVEFTQHHRRHVAAITMTPVPPTVTPTSASNTTAKIINRRCLIDDPLFVAS